MDYVTTTFFRISGGDKDDIYQVDGVAGRVVQNVHCDPYCGMVVTFTDGSHLIVRERSQSGEIDTTLVGG